MGTLQIDILGTSFAIQAKEDSQYLENLLSYYRQMVEQVDSGANLHDELKTSILAGIMLCDELYKEKKQSVRNKNHTQIISDDLSEAERITLKLIDKIDKALC